MDIVGALKEFFATLGQAIGLVKQRDAEKNTAAMQQAKAAQVEQDNTDKLKTAIAKGDLNAIRKSCSE